MGLESSVYPIDVARKTPTGAAVIIPGVTFLQSKIQVTRENLSGESGLYRCYFAMLVAGLPTTYEFEVIRTRSSGQHGVGASAEAFITNGSVSKISVTATGNGYPLGPLVPLTTLTISAPPSGTTALATPVIVRGAIVDITITNPGSGYVTPPTITIASTAFNPTGWKFNGDNLFVLNSKGLYRFDIGVRAGDILDFILAGANFIEEISELRVDQIQIGA